MEIFLRILEILLASCIPLIICIINVKASIKKDALDREEKEKEREVKRLEARKAEEDARKEELRKQIENIHAVYTSQINTIKTDYSNQIKGINENLSSIKENMNALATEHKSSAELLSYKLDNLEAKQEKYNHLQERTYELESANKLFEEKFKHLEKAIGGI